MKKQVIILLLVLSTIQLAQALVISNHELTSISDNSMVVTWSTTDETSTTELEWGISELTEITTAPGTTKYHYLELTNLLPNTTYRYRLKSTGPSGTVRSPIATFKTLERPSGEYLFSFAVLNDLRLAPSKSNTVSGRGIPYQLGPQIIASEINDINQHNVDFTVINGGLAERNENGDLIGTTLKTSLEALNGSSNLPSSSYKYLPVPSFEDKKAIYTNDWITNAFGPLTNNRYGFTAADKDKDSIFNYQFKYQNYNFIFLDSVKNPSDATGLASLEVLNQYLSAESNSKTFIFMNYPAYNPFASDTKDYPVEIPTSEVGGAFNIDNHAAFRSTLANYKDSLGNPLVAAVISGHLGDNYLRSIEAISYIRQGPAVGFPTGYSIYKVYTNGFVKTFYKTKGRDAQDKPYYEHARDCISSEAGLPAAVLAALWLGSPGMRNFTVTYPYIPGTSPRVLTHFPASSESKVALNRSIIITFNKKMYNDSDLKSWVSINPSAGDISARFIDANRTILLVNHSSDFSEGINYTVTIDGSKAKDETGTAMGTSYSFSFDTNGATRDTSFPAASIVGLPDNTTTNPFPSFIGIASDESGVANIEYQIRSPAVTNWTTAEAVDGIFQSTMETFKITTSSPLPLGTHEVVVRTTDFAGNTSLTGFSIYSFTVAEEKPTISVKIDGASSLPGDPISSTPKIEITVSSYTSLESGRLTIDSLRKDLSFTKIDKTYYSTYEVSSALADGTHGLTIEAWDISGKISTFEIYPLYVQTSSVLTIQGMPLNYPNPYNPNAGLTTIGYVLSKPANISLRIFDIAGNLVAKKDFAANEEGGKAGYNQVSWDGKTEGGAIVGNGIYIYVLIADGEVIPNGKGKITVFK